MQKSVIIIPVFKEDMDKYEEISFVQAIKIFHDKDITLIAPSGLSVEKYLDHSQGDIKFKFFPGKHFRSVATYSKLLLEPQFYKQFVDYEYMLIYQLDAFVFSDRLDYWCEQGYDYIGAPWYWGCKEKPDERGLWQTGNGGFSLRNIFSTIKLLERDQKHFFSRKEILEEYSRFHPINKALKLPYLLARLNGRGNTSMNYIKTTKYSEDRVFATLAQNACSSYRMAPVEDAIKFSFECDPRNMYKLNNNQLPFGCHGWYRYDLDFWKPFIEAEGYEL